MPSSQPLLGKSSPCRSRVRRSKPLGRENELREERGEEMIKDMIGISHAFSTYAEHGALVGRAVSTQRDECFGVDRS